MSWAAAASIGASVVGGMLGDDAADGAAGAQSASAGQAIKEIREIGDRTRRDTLKYRQLGQGSADKLSTLLGIRTDNYQFDNPAANAEVERLLEDRVNRAATDKYGVQQQVAAGWNEKLNHSNNTGDAGYGSLLSKFGQSDLDNDVVYNTGLKFGLDQGNQAIERNATRFGNLDSGATLKALARYGNDYGNQRAGEAYNRFMGDKGFTLNALTGGAGIGQNAVSLDANTGSQMAQAIGGAQMAQGNAQAAGQIGGANAWSGALGGIANAVGGGSRGGSFNFGSLFGGGVGGKTNAIPGAYYV